MIIQGRQTKRQTQEKNAKQNKTFYSFSITPGRTNYIFKRTKPTQSIELNCVPNYNQSPKLNDASAPKNFSKNQKNTNTINLKIEQSNDISCTSFMKNYVEKLKKQRKRQNRKLKNYNDTKVQTERLSRNGKTMFNQQPQIMKQTNHIFVLQRIPHKIGNGVMNTISVVEENLYNQVIQREKTKSRKEKIKESNEGWEEPPWANKEKIEKLIKQIRNSRSKINSSNADSSLQEDEFKNKKFQDSYNFPVISKQLKSRQLSTRKSSKEGSKEGKKSRQMNFKHLEPWKHELHPQQFSIQEYYNKQGEQFF